MATIDLGKIKLVWRGTYNNSTAYTVDDVVEFTDGGILSSYICVANSTGNNPSSGGTAHASWNYMSKGSVQGGFTSHQVFTSSGTWTKPTGITKVKVTVTGGGGGGGAGSGNWNAKGGGGGGGTAIEVIDVSSVSTVSVTVGSGGSGGAGEVVLVQMVVLEALHHLVLIVLQQVDMVEEKVITLILEIILEELVLVET